jgi:hypothetical protein
MLLRMVFLNRWHRRIVGDPTSSANLRFCPKMTVLENVLAGLELSTRSSLAGVVLGLRSDGLAASSL